LELPFFVVIQRGIEFTSVIIGFITNVWMKYLRPYAVTLKDGIIEKNLYF